MRTTSHTVTPSLALMAGMIVLSLALLTPPVAEAQQQKLALYQH